MPYLILPSRRTRQPQGVVRINPAHWAAPNCVGVVIAGAYVSGVPANPLPLVAGDGGLAYSSASLSTEMTFDKVVSPQSAGLTTITRLVRYGAQPDGGFGTAFLYPQLSGVQTPICFFVKDAGERFRVNVTTDDDTSNSYETTTAYPVGTWQTSAMTWKSGSVPAIYRNANALTLSYNGGALTGVLKPSSALKINLAALRLNGAVAWHYIFNRFFSTDEIAAITASPFEIVASSPRRIWFDAGAGGGAVTLVHNDSTQAQSADNALLTTQSFLVVGDATQSHTSENVVLDASVSTNLVVQESTQAHTSENAVLTASSNLVLQDATQAQASDNVILTSAHSIIIQECTHNHTSENINLDSGLILTVADALSTQQVDNLELLAACLLSIDDSNHTQLADSIDLSTLHSLNIAETAHAITSESPTLTIPGSGTGATAEEIAAAVLAALEATTIPVDIKKVNSVSITGIGTDPNPWRAV